MRVRTWKHFASAAAFSSSKTWEPDSSRHSPPMGRRLSQWWWSGEQCWMGFHLTDIESIRIGSESLERLWLFMDFTCYNWPRRWFKTEIPVLHKVTYVTMLHSGAGASVDKHLEVTYLHFLQKCEVLGFVCRLAVDCVCVCLYAGVKL